MKIIKQIFLISILFVLASCSKQKAIELEDFNFDIKVESLVSDTNKYKTYSNYYQIKSEVIKVDTIFDGEFIGSEKPIQIQYTQVIFSNNDVLARFDDFDFNAINFATTLDGKIMVFNGIVGEIPLNQTQKFIELLNEKYGKATKTIGKFIKPFDIYTWQLNDRIIRYCVVGDEESNTLKIEVDQTDKIINNGEKKPHLKAYIYIIKNEYKDLVLGQEVNSGDFVYLE